MRFWTTLALICATLAQAQVPNLPPVTGSKRQMMEELLVNFPLAEGDNSPGIPQVRIFQSLQLLLIHMKLYHSTLIWDRT